MVGRRPLEANIPGSSPGSATKTYSAFMAEYILNYQRLDSNATAQHVTC